MHAKLTLISAPAGFGKTTLVIDWLSAFKESSAWLSLDENDNDIDRFFSYFITALQRIDPTLGNKTLTNLGTPRLPDVYVLISTLINEIVDLETSIVLILEDYHVITQPTVHEAVVFLLEHMPPQMHIIMNSRIDPPLPLSRLRASRQMIEIRGADLRFTETETATFLKQTMGLSLQSDVIQALEARTEGWIAGIQLAALSIRTLGDADRQVFIQALAGSDRFILDYLIEEVLNRQPQHVQDFLLKTSLLEQLCGPLCEAVLCDGGEQRLPGTGQEMLEYLEQNNLFLISLDNKREWYRYHHLFTDLLRNQLVVLHPDLVSNLHSRASAWYAKNDLLSEAIVHSLAARDWERAAELIDKTMNDMMSRGEYYTTMLDRLKALPEEIVWARPHLAVSYAWLLSIILNLDDAEFRLREVERIAGQKLSADIRLEILVIRASLARQRKEYVKATELTFKSLDALPENPPEDSPLQREARTGILFNLGYIYLFSKGDVVESDKWFSNALSISEEAGSVTLTLGAMDGKAHCKILQGKLHQAEEIYRKGLQIAGTYQQKSGQEIPASSYAHIGLGNLLREQGKLEEASYHLSLGMELSRRWQIGDVLCNGYIYQARLRQAQKDFDGALESIRQAEQLPNTYRSVPRYGGPTKAWYAYLLLMKGTTDNRGFDPGCLYRVQKWAEGRSLRLNGPINSYDDECEYLVLARLLFAQGEHEKALQLLAGLLQAAEDYRRTGRVIEILVLKALALQGHGDANQALKVLAQTLHLAEPEGYFRLFVDEGDPMAKLLRRTATNAISHPYVARLLEAFEDETAYIHTSSHSAVSMLIEPLSGREMEVLRLLVTELSGSEIAERLFVSLNTVKTHIKNIYSKLNVHSRSEAVELAKKLHLIP
jgi:LuxR family maltose regulon positive regulatory protein